MKDDPSLADQIRSLEEKLLSPAVRTSPEALSELLAADFFEFGSSGRRYSKEEILEALPAETDVRFTLSDFTLESLAPGMVLATYQVLRSTAGGEPARRSLRSSIWVLRASRWQMRFHQGTPVEN